MPMPLKDLTGQRFGRLTVIERAENDKSGNTRWKCRCECGNEVVTQRSKLIDGTTKSCGCFRVQKAIERCKQNITHGMSKTKTYKLWVNIISRCKNPSSTEYFNYGGRGISICEQWCGDFQAFYDYVSQLEHFGDVGFSLDRIDNNGNYEPGNLRFADMKTQARNRRSNHLVEYEGKLMTIAEAAEKSGICHETLRHRYHAGDRGEKLFRPTKLSSRKS